MSRNIIACLYLYRHNSMIKIGTRGSKLALWQAKFLSNTLKDRGFESDINIIKTKGDQIQNLSFDKIEGKGFFTKEIEDALLDKKVDLAVHSMKDLPTDQPDGLVLCGVSYRENPQDILLIRNEKSDPDKPYQLGTNAIVGTSSARRKCLIKHFADHPIIKDIRGNVPTRIEKLRSGEFDAILLAKAGIERLNLDLTDLTEIALNPREFIPAPAQGVLAFQCREDDIEMRKKINLIHNKNVSAVTNIERRVLQLFDGGCHLPLGVFCYKDNIHNYHCYAAYSEDFESAPKFTTISQSTSHQLAERVFENLKKQ